MAGKDKKQISDEEEQKDAPRDKHNLDEGLEESMDASDPPSSTQP